MSVAATGYTITLAFSFG